MIAAAAVLVLAVEAVVILFWGGVPALSCEPSAETVEGMVHISDDRFDYYIDRYE